MRNRFKWIGLTVLAVFIGLAIASSLGVFDDRHYYEVPHGSHTHYVAKDRDPNADISSFPTRPPRPGERISPQGQFVPDTTASN
ncbi:MAG: hypothetical protein HKN43_15715 [Rhodothermales bacterium]|nr:hypothetical protein [Rhodothermales bacterium]